MAQKSSDIGGYRFSSKASAAFAFPFLIGYLWKDRSSRMCWMAALVAFLLQFVIFKFHYPFAN
jgi:hypothetical protein